MGIIDRLFKLYFSNLFKDFKSSKYSSFNNFDEYYKKFNKYWEQYRGKNNNSNNNYQREQYNYQSYSYKNKMSEHQKKIAQYYANLEVPNGSDFETVKKAWKKLLLKYHPDKHNDNEEKRKTANILTQKLNEAYYALEKELKK